MQCQREVSQTTFQDASPDVHGKLMEAATQAQKSMENFRLMSQAAYSRQKEFRSEIEVAKMEEIARAKMMSFVPPNLPALQIVGGEQWRKGYPLYESAGAFPREFIICLNFHRMNVDEHWDHLMVVTHTTCGGMTNGACNQLALKAVKPSPSLPTTAITSWPSIK